MFSLYVQIAREREVGQTFLGGNKSRGQIFTQITTAAAVLIYLRVTSTQFSLIYTRDSTALNFTVVIIWPRVYTYYNIIM